MEECQTCQYAESCKFCSENPAPQRYSRDSKDHYVSLEAFQYSKEIASIPAPDDSDVAMRDRDFYRPVYSNADMQKLLEFLLRGVDDYTMAITLCVLRENVTSAAQAAKAFGVSREAMHRKLVDSCMQYPYLRDTLRSVLYRCKTLADPENRSQISGRRMRGAAKEKTQTEDLQMELFSCQI